jgi:acyl dehydratase
MTGAPAVPTRLAGDAWRGRVLGTRTVEYADRDAILYALAVGAHATRLDLVFEERLRVLPGFALTLAQWAPDALGTLGAFDTRTAVHGAQRLDVLAPLPRSGTVQMTARVGEVWDKGSAAVFEVAVESDWFVATWSVFAPGAGGFGGERGPASSPTPHVGPDRTVQMHTSPDQAALYRLLGDRHHMHIDPVAASEAGQPRPFLHGLCTLAGAALTVADAYRVHPADVVGLETRFAAPVFPGESLTIRCWGSEPTSGVAFMAAAADGRTVLSGGLARFRDGAGR